MAVATVHGLSFTYEGAGRAALRDVSLAVAAGEVPDELFAKVVKQYGEQEAFEFSVAIAWWSFWAMIINATRTDFDFGYGKPNS